VVVRFLTLLLAVIMMTGVVAQGSAQASSSVLVDAPDVPDLDPVVLPTCTALAPAIIATRVIVPPAPPEPTGRLHAVRVFRPPR
jgi:hypothetical protein